MEDQKRGRITGGIPAKRLTFPIIAVLAVLHFVIICLIMGINASSSRLSRTMQNSSVYIEDATSLLAGSSLLSETASNFVLMPLSENGEVNTHPLIAYANELEAPRRGSDVLERFQDYEVSPAIVGRVSEAAAAAGKMMNAQLHALALTTSVYPLRDEELASRIPIPSLSEAEEKLSPEQKIAKAHSLVLGSEYGHNKQTVSSEISACTGMIKEAMGQQAAASSRRIGLLRTALWVVTASIIVLLSATFIVFYRQMILPLTEFTALINSASRLDETSGLAEIRRLAAAYNGLLRRRDALDNILRSAAETDALTNLPNRYGYEQYILDLQDESYAVALILFDVNYLKYTNDTFGHAAGDTLLRSSAECISACFGSPDEHNCFRFGGDEFAAVVKNASPEEINRMVRHFQEDQKKRDISISWGCSYTDDITDTDFREMMDKADREMYERKRIQHTGTSLDHGSPSGE